MSVKQTFQLVKKTFDNNETELTDFWHFSGAPDMRTQTETAVKLVLILLKLTPPCFTRCIQSTTVLEALHLKSEHTETNPFYIPSLLYSVNPNDPSQRGARK